MYTPLIYTMYTPFIYTMCTPLIYTMCTPLIYTMYTPFIYTIYTPLIYTICIGVFLSGGRVLPGHGVLRAAGPAKGGQGGVSREEAAE